MVLVEFVLLFAAVPRMFSLFAVRACKNHLSAEPCAHEMFRPRYFTNYVGFASPVQRMRDCIEFQLGAPRQPRFHRLLAGGRKQQAIAVGD
jgi:hypothetical protein